MIEITKITEDIFRFDVPYKDIFVGVFVLKAPGGAVLFDAAATDEDVDNYIVPALEQLGVENLKYVFISHHHKDHSGGLARLRQVYPEICIVSRSEALQERYAGTPFQFPEDGEAVGDVFRVVTIPGHTVDSEALLDKRTNTLLTGDCLQLYGIYGSGQWGAAIRYVRYHIEAIAKVREMDIDTIITAHDYHPYGTTHAGKEGVKNCLDASVDALKRISSTIWEYPTLDDDAIAEKLNDGSLPTVGPHIVAAVRKGMAEGAV